MLGKGNIFQPIPASSLSIQRENCSFHFFPFLLLTPLWDGRHVGEGCQYVIAPVLLAERFAVSYSSTYEFPGDLVRMQIPIGSSGIGHEIVPLQQAPPSDKCWGKSRQDTLKRKGLKAGTKCQFSSLTSWNISLPSSHIPSHLSWTGCTGGSVMIWI